MIVSRPRPNALFALTVFIIISLVLAYLGLQEPIKTGNWNWYNYIAVYFFGSMACILSLRILYNFKVIYVTKGKFEFWFPFRMVKKKWSINELEYWKEEQIKTGKTMFRELEMNFGKKRYKISMQENSSYLKIYDYLNKKAGKKKNG